MQPPLPPHVGPPPPVPVTGQLLPRLPIGLPPLDQLYQMSSVQVLAHLRATANSLAPPQAPPPLQLTPQFPVSFFFVLKRLALKFVVKPMMPPTLLHVCLFGFGLGSHS